MSFSPVYYFFSDESPVGAVIVCTPQDLALLDAVRGVNMFKKVNVPVTELNGILFTPLDSRNSREYELPRVHKMRRSLAYIWKRWSQKYRLSLRKELIQNHNKKGESYNAIPKEIFQNKTSNQKIVIRKQHN